MTLNDQLDSSIVLGVDGMLLQDLMATKITGPKKDLIGDLHMELNLVTFAVLAVIAQATPPTTQPSTAEPAEPPSPLQTVELPANWGWANIELTHARLAGLELIQGMGNIAKLRLRGSFQARGQEQTGERLFRRKPRKSSARSTRITFRFRRSTMRARSWKPTAKVTSPWTSI